MEGSAPGIRKRANGFALSEYRAPRHSLKIAFEEAGSKGDLSILKTLNGGAVQAKLKLGCHTSSILQSFVRNAPLAFRSLKCNLKTNSFNPFVNKGVETSLVLELLVGYKKALRCSYDELIFPLD